MRANTTSYMLIIIRLRQTYQYIEFVEYRIIFDKYEEYRTILNKYEER